MKVLTLMWASYLPLLQEAAEDLGLHLLGFSTKQISKNREWIKKIAGEVEKVDLILLYRTHDVFWEEIEEILRPARERVPLIVIGSDPSFGAFSNVHPEMVVQVYRYLLFGGKKNMVNMFKYLLRLLFGEKMDFEGPEEVPWQGIFHPGMETAFEDTDQYLSAYRGYLSFLPESFVGVLYSRSNWVNNNMEVERSLVSKLEEQGLGVIPVFLYSLKDQNLGNLSGVEVMERFFLKDRSPRVEGVIKLTSFFLASTRGGLKESETPSGVSLLKKMGVPLFCPVISYYKSKEQWLADGEGLGSQVGWSVAMPEFEGVIEPILVGAIRGVEDSMGDTYEAIEDRVEKLAKRVSRWIALRKKPNREKRVAFILHNNPCASVEATVGGGAHLDTLESVSDLLKRMAAEGYQVLPPENGKALIDEIMSKKAISEFRWTTVEEIVEKGGALALLENERYLQWFNELPETTQRRMIEAWGNPPGERKNGIPPAMVHDGKIVVTGIRYGNAVVCVQPKRGCAGARCDGEVCKILHDPSVPPPHQYVATYKWLSRDFGADVLIHVGTHGNLEFLPGKGTGLSSGCFPDIGIDSVPHLYIYNADNPPEGIIAKRRSNAVLVDHMQTVMTQGDLYGDLLEVDKLLEEYHRFKQSDPYKSHTLMHMIMNKVTQLNLLDGAPLTHDNFDEQVQEIHEKLSLLKKTYIPKGMHIFGRVPEGEECADFIYAILRYDTREDSLRSVVQKIVSCASPLEGEAVAEKAETIARDLCRDYIVRGRDLWVALADRFPITETDRGTLRKVQSQIDEIRQRIIDSDEVGALLSGMNGRYIEPGPSGLITRGRPDVLPTGRNFYGLDPKTLPSRAAWEIGRSLAEKTLQKYLDEEGTYPETIAFYWQCSDLMWANGEGMAQMMALMGARPLWEGSGRVKGFEIIPLDQLGRPRIDITVRVSGITRDNFPNVIELLDEIVQTVAALEEPASLNFIRKHTLERLEREKPDPEAMRKATYRIFGSMPGTYQAGTQLAVYASAWKTEKDLADVFLYWNGYAYGKEVFGESAHQSLKENLKLVDLTFNKTVTDEYDLTGCCCYFGAHGGMINAAKVISGREIKNYYGDTRDPNEIAIRTLSEEIRRVARAKLLNPKWIEGMKEHGYKGASEISKRIGRLYGWQATSRAVDGAIFDDVARTFLMDEENRRFFEQNNPWALEEIARRLIEAAERGLWEPSPDIKEALKQIYVEIEGWVEERMGEVKGDFQGGNIDILTPEEVGYWKKKMEEILG
ncbi:MAG: cobaltochelatase subunit CobN [Desulfobacterota bacterium]|nr:cobaltochelatase subunit CobN [Thermodesulfobacteriota bacterium]